MLKTIGLRQNALDIFWGLFLFSIIFSATIITAEAIVKIIKPVKSTTSLTEDVVTDDDRNANKFRLECFNLDGYPRFIDLADKKTGARCIGQTEQGHSKTLLKRVF